MGVSLISNRSGQRSRGWSRRGILAALGAVPAAAALAGCSSSAGASAGADGKGATASARTATTKRSTIAVTPAAGARKADFTSPVEVTVTDGTLASVHVTGNDGSTLEGTLNSAGTKWISARNPYSGTKYTVTAEAAGAAGETVSTFTTRSPGATFVGRFTPEAGSTSGIGRPVSVSFTHAVADRARRRVRHPGRAARPAAHHLGHQNASHGCIGLHDTKGAGDSSVAGYEFYESSMLGDVVIVKNSGERTVDPANGLNGWNPSWADWRAGSAV
ncbi:Ig-like domain-containing protein [Streptomyces sp. PTD9-10]|uniref:Ig-like domain-containing protein n=1 Tax=Streptomyces sp. PTD9-10 TaxID=3120151 RepID=UPI003FCCA4BF